MEILSTGFPQDIQKMEPIHTNTRELLTAEELAAFLGVHKTWIYARTVQGQKGLPHLRVGKHLRFQKDKVLEFLAQQPSI